MFESAAQYALLAVWIFGLGIAVRRFVDRPVTSLCVGCAFVLCFVASGFGSSRVAIVGMGSASYWILAVAFLLLMAAAFAPENSRHVQEPEIDVRAVIAQRDLSRKVYSDNVEDPVDDDNEENASRPNLPR